MTDSWIFASFMVVVPSIAVSLIAVWIVRKIFRPETLKTHHDVAGVIFSIVGVLYSVILGFTVIKVEERYNIVQQMIHTEATMLVDLSRDANVFSLQDQQNIRSHLREYITYVIQEEWGKEDIHLQAQTILKKIWDSYYSIDLVDDKMKIWYELSISKLDRLQEARLTREYSSWQRLNDMMKSVLIGGAIITASFVFFFGLERMRTQMLMMALLVGYLSFMLFLVFTLDDVFKDPEGVKPIAFQKVLPLI